EGSAGASTGVRVGRVFSRERTFLRGADAVRTSGRHTGHVASARRGQAPRSQRPPRTHGYTMPGNWEISELPAGEGTVGPHREAGRGRRWCTAPGNRTAAKYRGSRRTRSGDQRGGGGGGKAADQREPAPAKRSPDTEPTSCAERMVFVHKPLGFQLV